MAVNFTYVISQILVICCYLFLLVTYYVKDRKKILLFSFLSLIAMGLSYLMLEAYTGMIMVVVAIIRNTMFINNENKKRTISELSFLIVLIVTSAIFTYDGLESLLPTIATTIYTYSLWQKNQNLYKYLGIPVEMLGIIYNSCVKSYFGVMGDTIILLSILFGIIINLNKKQSENKLIVKAIS